MSKLFVPTHDLGFTTQPWEQPGWKIDRYRHCFDSMVTAAKALASRFDASVGAIRSWDTRRTREYLPRRLQGLPSYYGQYDEYALYF